ncbi:MAG: helix-turn-helix transcriptional regulator [Chloroflexi bacterium]|nr:helix-turn-helix transcriptional regulator [Chloroflexota bacterium]
MALATYVKNGDRMMTYARAVKEGIELAFADGFTGLVPYADLPEIGELANLAAIELPNPYEVILKNTAGETSELPWDFARHYCDPSYEGRVMAIAALGRQAIGSRIRRLREASEMTQAELASAAGVGRVTLVRIESGEQSPRYETLVALAAALRRPLAELLAGQSRQ